MEGNVNVKHRLVQLPHFLLSNIINLLEFDIDRLCFALTCKRWLNERDSYLTLNHHNSLLPKVQSIEYIKGFCLISFKKQFEQSRNLAVKTRLKYAINGTNLHLISKSFIPKFKINTNDYFVFFDQIKDYFTIPKSVNLFYLHNDINLKLIYDAIAKSNVDTFIYNRCIQVLQPGALPPNIRTLKFYHNICPLQPGCLPPNLTSLTMSNPKTLQIGVLPESLEHLDLSNSGYINNDFLTVGTLPPNLRSITFDHHFQQQITREMLPSIRLETIVNLPRHSLGELPQCVTTVTLSAPKLMTPLPLPPLQAGEIPTTLTSLDFGFNCIDVDFALIPTSIKILNLGSVRQINHRNKLPESIEELSFGEGMNPVIKEGSNFIPKSVRKLVLPKYNHSRIESIPKGIEWFAFNHYCRIESIPDTVKLIRFDYKHLMDTTFTFEIRRLAADLYLIVGDKSTPFCGFVNSVFLNFSFYKKCTQITETFTK
ncbi:hypothetical protein PPL_03762 [Heterostelium album PN500]|uniref:F-box domain-containing protein n=1 Tax=Heterostelium pallidum (strain ATCC 26659 / Pp 5 / PN500) TaxID=670386 RepID=D3B6L4_HETP5|nr:hypothetical protein PPL_03762 [Heterostelium album PN500]EFA82984.1 hypothetical protein PPL_03762 [Heterostelium album PN500]|eukprot:XP_020435101.1 hypothetical protein PPL_03762 [Heterostelium album PN500]